VINVERPWLRAYVKMRASNAAEHFEKRHRQGDIDPIEPGTRVMIKDVRRESKSDSPYIGPFSIISFDDASQSYAVMDSTGCILNRRVTLDMLKLVPLATNESDLEYEVERLVNHKKVKGEYSYQVKWKGFDELTWEPVGNILDDNLVRRYWTQRHNNKVSKTEV
jgi:hypothetical protein